MARQKRLLGWHWNNGECRYNVPTPIKIGKTLRVRGKLQMCSNGLHASTEATFIPKYGRGSNLDLVISGTKHIMELDKWCSNTRTHILRINIYHISLQVFGQIVSKKLRFRGKIYGLLADKKFGEAKKYANKYPVYPAIKSVLNRPEELDFFYYLKNLVWEFAERQQKYDTYKIEQLYKDQIRSTVVEEAKKRLPKKYKELAEKSEIFRINPWGWGN